MKAHARNTDPDTSHEAAEAASITIRKIQQEVLAFSCQCGVRGYTDLELADFFDSTSSTYRTRRSELVALGLVEDTGSRVSVNGGRRHAIWAATPAGYARLAALLALDLPRAA
ncbi:hypothetical protein M8312_11865 [Sphingomonas sp. KRR8]|uniref:hypothetical protein n=1 Tax=Sphingomonas sp. KRR8 TaxID=2942996 RepID=UPI00202228C4|nr:hypothetical protein [Sphingomonas sp. KRR8]URD60472.1 hypothetical protein M8312_11865 [Sphingomonas sp. KRR8]